ncbi:hypothetical protein L1987_37703 [Smallanthus sonchifolius]|uniref:Uncharacterized protein n=1 Tax=Smallanthus sonchifolius TaxID=185202 RepID=A0ACB9HGW4_9ASTR|nr:hypothetical protein L1987_37703 [Smallanthus sonchifolius]
MGTRFNVSTAYHPKTDGQSERTIQTLEDMLRACIIDFGDSWDSHLPLAEFSYNNSHHTTIGMPPYKMLYGRRCRTPVFWGEIGQKELGSLEVVRETSERFGQIKARMKAAQDRQKSYADKRRRPIKFDVGDRVMLKVSPWKGIIQFRKRGKLSSKFVGPFRIIARVGEVAYRLELHDELSGIHPTFHVSHLRKCLADESAHVPLTDIEVDNSLNYSEEPVAILERKEKHPKAKVRVFARKQFVRTYQVRMKLILRTYQVRKERILRTYQVRMKQGPMWLANCCTTGVMTVTKGIIVILEFWYELPYGVVMLEGTCDLRGAVLENEMAGRKSGRRGGGRIGGRTGGRNGGRGRTPARQEYSEEGSVHTEPAISVHGTEQTQVEEQPFTFEPEVRAAIAR